MVLLVVLCSQKEKGEKTRGSILLLEERSFVVLEVLC